MRPSAGEAGYGILVLPSGYSDETRALRRYCACDRVITAADAIRVHFDGGYRARSGSAACVARASFTYYHVGGTVVVAGTVGGAPSSGFRVTIVVKRCYRSGGVQTVKTVYARGGAGGSFKGSFQVQVPSDCYVQVHYLRVTSNRTYFRVR